MENAKKEIYRGTPEGFYKPSNFMGFLRSNKHSATVLKMKRGFMGDTYMVAHFQQGSTLKYVHKVHPLKKVPNEASVHSFGDSEGEVERIILDAAENFD